MEEKFKGTYFISSISFTTMVIEYGISAIFILFLIYVLHFSTSLSSNIYSYYYGFAYIVPIFIGYISDKYLNKTETLILGFISLILSQLILSFSSSLYYPSDIIYYSFFFNHQNVTYIVGLFFLGLGTGFANISITSMINELNDDDSIHHAFSIYYPIINFGVMFGVIIMSIIIGDGNYHQCKWAFLFFAIILIIGLISFLLLKKRYLVDNNGNSMKDDIHKNSIINDRNRILQKISSKTLSEIKNLNIKGRLSLLNKSLPHKNEFIFAFLIFLIINIFYRVSFSQTSSSLVLFLDSYVIRDTDFFEIPVQLFSVLNPICIILLSPIFIKFNHILDEKNIELGFVNRVIISMIFLTLCFGLLTVLGYFLDIDILPMNKIYFTWIIVFEVLLAISELFFSVTSYSLISNLAPERYYSLLFGIYTATRAIAMYMAGQISSFFPEDITPTFVNNIPINGLMSYFLIFVILTSMAIVILLVSRNKLERVISEGEEFNN